MKRRCISPELKKEKEELGFVIHIWREKTSDLRDAFLFFFSLSHLFFFGDGRRSYGIDRPLLLAVLLLRCLPLSVQAGNDFTACSCRNLRSTCSRWYSVHVRNFLNTRSRSHWHGSRV